MPRRIRVWSTSNDIFVLQLIFAFESANDMKLTDVVGQSCDGTCLFPELRNVLHYGGHIPQHVKLHYELCASFTERH